MGVQEQDVIHSTDPHQCHGVPFYVMGQRLWDGTRLVSGSVHYTYPPGKVVPTLYPADFTHSGYGSLPISGQQSQSLISAMSDDILCGVAKAVGLEAQEQNVHVLNQEQSGTIFCMLANTMGLERQQEAAHELGLQ